MAAGKWQDAFRNIEIARGHGSKVIVELGVLDEGDELRWQRDVLALCRSYGRLELARKLITASFPDYVFGVSGCISEPAERTVHVVRQLFQVGGIREW